MVRKTIRFKDVSEEDWQIFTEFLEAFDVGVGEYFGGMVNHFLKEEVKVFKNKVT